MPCSENQKLAVNCCPWVVSLGLSVHKFSFPGSSFGKRPWMQCRSRTEISHEDQFWNRIEDRTEDRTWSFWSLEGLTSQSSGGEEDPGIFLREKVAPEGKRHSAWEDFMTPASLYAFFHLTLTTILWGKRFTDRENELRVISLVEITQPQSSLMRFKPRSAYLQSLHF